MQVFKIQRTSVHTDAYSVCREERWKFIDVTCENHSISKIQQLNYQCLKDIQHRLTLENYILVMNTLNILCMNHT